MVRRALRRQAAGPPEPHHAPAEQDPYKKAPREKVKLPKRQKAHGYKEPRHPYKYVPDVS